ncbi:MAG: hypothetical protein AAB542_04065 [Patescibacteria group bacterium]
MKMTEFDKQNLENIRTKYSSALSLKASEGEIQWNRYNSMLVVNTIIIGFIGLIYSNDFSFPSFYKILFQLIPFLGLTLCSVWYHMTKRGFFWTSFWINEANKLERKIAGGVNPVINGKRERDRMGAGITKSFSLWIINIFAIVYFSIFLYNLLSLLFVVILSKIVT